MDSKVGSWLTVTASFPRMQFMNCESCGTVVAGVSKDQLVYKRHWQLANQQMGKLQ